MDRDLLSRMIIELVATHDVVGLPGLGTFVAEEVSASFSDKGFTINPPYRKLSFKHKCIEDQLLVEFYSNTNNVPIDIAQGYIFQYISGLRDVLQERKTVVLPGLGRLRATRENNFFFVPEEDLDISPSYFGLNSVSLKSHPLIDEKVDIPFDYVPSKKEDNDEGLPRPDGLAMTEETTVTENESLAMTENEDNVQCEEENVDCHCEEQCDEAIPMIEEVSDTKEDNDEGLPRPDGLAMTEETTVTENESLAMTENETTKKKFRWWIIPIVLIIIAIIAFAAFYILAQVAPDFIDSILYTPEELWIINY